MKAQLRKSLKQNKNESVKEFCDRCKEAEQLIFDQQIQDVAFERDLLLTFLIGLREELQLKVMQSEGSSLSDFLQAAIKIENNEDIKVCSWVIFTKKDILSIFITKARATKFINMNIF